MGIDIDSLLVSPQRPKVLLHAKEELQEAQKMLEKRAKRRPRAERNKTKARDDAAMKEQLARLAEAKKELEEVKNLPEPEAMQEEASCAAELDEVAQNILTANFRSSQAVRGQSDTEAVLRSWASSPEAQECPRAVDMIEEHGPIHALARMERSMVSLRPNPHEPLPAIACKLLFDLVFNGCQAGSTMSIKLLQTAVDRYRPQQCDASCLQRIEPKPANRLAAAFDWVPSDSEFLQALKNLGYVAPDDEEQLPAEANSPVPLQRRLYGAAKQWDLEMQQHPNEHNVIATCKAITILAEAFLTSTSQEPGTATPRTPTAAPPFGRSPQLITAITRLHHDRSLNMRECRRTTHTALHSLFDLGTDTRAWSTSMAQEIPTLLKNMPSSQSVSMLCSSLKGSLRAIRMQQAAAAYGLLNLHGFAKDVQVESVGDVPVKAVMEQLGTVQDILARLTPSDDSTAGKPAGWDVLSTMELILQMVEAEKHKHVFAARQAKAIGCTENLLSLVEPIAKGVEKSLKKRQSVSVMRTRLLCNAIMDTIRESEGMINEQARQCLNGSTVHIE